MIDIYKEDKSQKIVDYKCESANESGFSDKIIRDLNLAFPGTYNDADIMAKTAVAIKNENASQICLLPFCHTVEAEALGGRINLSDGKYGPRAADYMYHSVDELLHLPDFNFEQGRISQVLKACRILKAQEEKVVLEVSGYLTILNSLIDISQIFKALRKDAEQVTEIFNILANNLYSYFEEAQKAGVDIISYADPAGGVNIVGPKYTEMITRKFTFPLLKKATTLIGEKCIIHLCPKTSLILLSLGLAERQDLRLGGKMHYDEACLSTIGKKKIIGQACLKDPCNILKDGNIWAFNFV